ncbi:MAG: hypothetical protein PHQ59_04885 [Candidatus Daviesbacteria bacterium]|nr:hypothetical protein [Candidatus Daviesbacteria bacterium]
MKDAELTTSKLEQHQKITRQPNNLMLPTPEKLQIINLLEANLKERDYFASQVDRCKGKLHVLTHPFYHEEFNGYPEIPGYAKARDILIKSCITHDIPLVIFEESSKCRTLSLKIPEIPGILYVVKTEGASNYLEYDHYQNQKKLTALFKWAGVSRIVAGGQYMFLRKFPQDVKNPHDRRTLNDLGFLKHLRPNAKKWIDQRIIPEKCAGGIASNFLISGFDVSLSPVSSPHNFYLGHCKIVQGS